MSQYVLIVEDDPAIADALSGMLELEGLVSITARDGVEALERVADDRPSAIVLDLMLPRMDGFGFVAELEARGWRAGVPIVVMTADGRAEQKAARIGADAWVEKPFNLVSFAQLVVALIHPP